VKDAHTINQALGYEMNTIEFAIKDGVPYAIDFLNPAPDFERDRITEFYFTHVVDRMARLVIDRALHGEASYPWPRWEQMLGVGAATGYIGAPGRPVPALAQQPSSTPPSVGGSPQPSSAASPKPRPGVKPA
jgi:hypothetical protein